MKSSVDHYGTVAVTIHWVTVLLILLLVGTGFRAGGAEDAMEKAAILRLHVPFGIAILLLTIARIGWWLFMDKKPDSIAMPTWQDRASRFVHVLFYIVILGLVASGIGMVALSQAVPIIFGSSADALPNFHDYPPRTPHGVGARLLLVLFAIHLGAALYHHFIMKDGLLRRMWFSSTDR